MTESTISATDRGAKGGTREVALTLLQHYSGFYGDVELYWEDGAEVVTWMTDGDNPSPGFSPEPAAGPVEFYPLVPLGTQGKYRGIRVGVASIIAIDLVGGFGGVADVGGSSITVHIRQNGTIISSQTQYDPEPAWHGWVGSFTFSLPDILAAAGDEFEASVRFAGWSGFEYFATIPGQLNPATHFRVTGETRPGGPFLRGHATFAASL